MNAAPLLTSATYVALLLAVFGLWFGRRVWLPALLVAVALGYASGVLNAIAVVWIALLEAACIFFDLSRGRATLGSRVLMAFATLAIIVLALLLGMHALPGFHNFLAFEKVVLSPGAEPYTLYLNFDKTVVGILIVGHCGSRLLTRLRDWARAFRQAAPITATTIVLVALGALALGYFTWQPKWTPLFWLWAANNLFFVCLSEEAFFRAFIQRELRSALSGTRYAAVLSISASAILFGLAHFAGGLEYVLLATAAGLGYALVYHRTQSIEMSMLTHFILNAAHFLLFTYPRAV